MWGFLFAPMLALSDPSGCHCPKTACNETTPLVANGTFVSQAFGGKITVTTLGRFTVANRHTVNEDANWSVAVGHVDCNHIDMLAGFLGKGTVGKDGLIAWSGADGVEFDRWKRTKTFDQWIVDVPEYVSDMMDALYKSWMSYE